eukprot:COSAG02_NODE_33412_length_500_cov_1.032419_1_plen_59_part_10
MQPAFFKSRKDFIICIVGVIRVVFVVENSLCKLLYGLCVDSAIAGLVQCHVTQGNEKDR